MGGISSEQSIVLAKQGDLRAIALKLNQQLTSKGAHIKLKRKKECLQILLKAPKSAEQEPLIEVVAEQLQELQPEGFTKVRIYEPIPGAKTASLIYKAALSPSNNQSTYLATERKPKRYSVAKFLAQVNHIEELKALQDHPFYTGHCPQCGYQFGQLSPLPEYWDCSQCGWTDDLSHLAPQHIGQTLQQKTTKAELKRLGRYLVEANLVTEDQIRVALADQQLTGMRLGDALVKRGWISRETIEYLMKKVILPERSSTQEISYLESSRTLVRTLLTQVPDDQPADSFLAENADDPGLVSVRNPNSLQPPTGQPPNDRATLVVSTNDIDTYSRQMTSDSATLETSEQASDNSVDADQP